MQFKKKIRKVDSDLLARIRLMACLGCNAPPPSQPDHISTRGSGGGDTEDNLWPLCQRCHVEKGMGFEKFLKTRPRCVEFLIKKGRQDVFNRFKRI